MEFSLSSDHVLNKMLNRFTDIFHINSASGKHLVLNCKAASLESEYDWKQNFKVENIRQFDKLCY